MYQLQHIDPARFLREYWQKKPLLIRGGFNNFEDPLDEHDLAGLAMEEDIDARVVSQQDGQWQVEQGPFASFDEVCKGQWSLLVQNVDGYIDEASLLLSAFDFIPRWRVDDLMVSFSVPGAGVGPHLDQYDVFIIQGKGTRRWQVGEKGEHAPQLPHPKLSQVAMFEPIIDAELQCGDILYIPPGFPHCGVALTDCLNYSVGFRAPDQKALLSDFADFALIQSEHFNQRYADPDLASREFAGEILPSEIDAVRQMMKSALDSPLFDQWLASYMSFANDTVALPTPLLTETQVKDYLLDGQPVSRSLDVKAIWRKLSDSQVMLHLGDSLYPASVDILPVLESLLSAPGWFYAGELTDAELDEITALLTQWLNRGYWRCDLQDVDDM